MNIFCLVTAIEDATPTNFSRGEMRLRDAIRYRNRRRKAIIPTLAISILALAFVSTILYIGR